MHVYICMHGTNEWTVDKGETLCHTCGLVSVACKAYLLGSKSNLEPSKYIACNVYICIHVLMRIHMYTHAWYDPKIQNSEDPGRMEYPLRGSRTSAIAKASAQAARKYGRYASRAGSQTDGNLAIVARFAESPEKVCIHRCCGRISRLLCDKGNYIDLANGTVGEWCTAQHSHELVVRDHQPEQAGEGVCWSTCQKGCAKVLRNGHAGVP